MMNNEFVPAYRNEPNVNSQSNTETFVAGKIENLRANACYPAVNSNCENASNLLVINVQPNEGFFFMCEW